MSEAICNTSPLQYLHQLDRLELLPRMLGAIIVPPAVVQEIAVGRSQGMEVPDLGALNWVRVETPARVPEELVIDRQLGPGERGVLALGVARPDRLLVLDDAKARLTAVRLKLRLIGTLGILQLARQAGFIKQLRPDFDRLDSIGFRYARELRTGLLREFGEL